jgi:hypothetical protein
MRQITVKCSRHNVNIISQLTFKRLQTKKLHSHIFIEAQNQIDIKTKLFVLNFNRHLLTTSHSLFVYALVFYFLCVQKRPSV